MLIIRDEYEHGNECIKASRVLPRPEWIDSCYGKLGIEVIGGKNALLDAARNRNVAYLEERSPKPVATPSNKSPHQVKEGKAKPARSDNAHLSLQNIFIAITFVSYSFMGISCLSLLNLHLF